MKIAIDVSQIVYGTGVSTYTENLVANLLQVDKQNEYFLFAGVLRRKEDLAKFFNSLSGKFTSLVFPLPPSLADILWNRIHFLPIDLLVGGIDVLHSSDWTQPKSGSYKVTTIHDLVPVKYPEYSHPKIVDVTKKRLEHVRSEVDKIIVPSRTTSEDLVKLGFDQDKLVVIPEAVDPIFTKFGVGGSRVLKRYSLNKKYLLSVGITERKNTKRIIESYRKIKKDLDIDLVFIGVDHIGLRETEGVRVLGHVDKKDIPSLYTNCEVVVYPSLYEGFGLPILEGYISKVPVVTSNIGSMKEIGGGAVLVDPYSVNTITNGILKAMSDRNVLVRRGITEVQKYSWSRNAKETLGVYKRS